MNMRKFKVGDKVRFKTYKEFVKEFGKPNEFDSFGNVKFGFTDNMYMFLGERGKINKIFGDFIKLKLKNKKINCELERFSISADMIKLINDIDIRKEFKL